MWGKDSKVKNFKIQITFIQMKLFLKNLFNNWALVTENISAGRLIVYLYI